MLPALLFFIAMVAFYPEIGAETLPSDFLLQRMNLPLFHLAFQLMIFSALLESATSGVHAINERIDKAWQRHRGGPLTHRARLTIALVLLVFCMFLASRFGLVDLIANGYRALAYLMLAVFVLPLRDDRHRPHPQDTQFPQHARRRRCRIRSDALAHSSCSPPCCCRRRRWPIRRRASPSASRACAQTIGVPGGDRGDRRERPDHASPAASASADLTAPGAVDADTIFATGSTGKAFTVAALAVLVDQGRIRWDDKVIDHIPDFRMYDPWVTREMTIRDLLVHRSGLGLGAGDLLFVPRSDLTREETMRAPALHPAGDELPQRLCL